MLQNSYIYIPKTILNKIIEIRFGKRMGVNNLFLQKY